jgi:putative effector of murein hydrolase
MLNRLRDKVYINNITWCLIQTIVLIIGTVVAFFIGLLIEVRLDKLSIELPILFSLIWILILIFAKIKIEDEFSDCIDA